MSDTDFVKACTRGELPADGRPKVLSLLGKKVGVFLQGDEIRALEMSCKHQGADLSKGRVDNGQVTCPRHGWRYDLETGQCLDPSDGAPLRFHEVKVEGEQVWVSLRACRW